VRIQLWSYNYDPEPTGIAPLASVWARAMLAREHQIDVVAAHPHYPAPVWGNRWMPYRERRDGISVLRLPLWVGRDSAFERVRQEATYTAALAAAAPTLRRPDIIVAVSPSFPALVPAMGYARVRGIPWVLWLQDILPEGAVATGVVHQGAVLRAALRLERAAYRSASRIVVLSETFRENLVSKGVPPGKLCQIYNPATRRVRSLPRPARVGGTVLTMGNIGYSQNLQAMVEAFEGSSALERAGATFVLAGDGVAGAKVRDAIRTNRVNVTGIVDEERLTKELSRASVALVSQHYAGAEFNVPSKLMNFMGEGLPTVASVSTRSEVARILRASRGGWVTNSAHPREAMDKLSHVLSDASELARRGAAALDFARANFSAQHTAALFDELLRDVIATDRASRSDRRR
jgi:colanic acid biosynthesis glycosyl transferase WcaI